MPDFVVALLVVGVYALLWSLSRWHNIALPTRKLLKAQLEGVRSRLYTEIVTADGRRSAERLENRLTAIGKAQHLGDEFFNFIFWSRGHPIAGWKEVHDVERQLVNFYSKERTLAYLAVAEGSLRDIKGREATQLADKIKALGFGTTSSPEQSELTKIYDLLQSRLPAAGGTPKSQDLVSDESVTETLKALLQEALRIIYTHTDSEYAKLVTWHNKAAWLMVAALAFIFLILSFHSGGAALLLAGGIGGVVSRLTRTLVDRKAVPTDYGAYWTSIYLSPVLGALAAWAGVLLVAAFASLDILNGPFENVRWQSISLQDDRFVLTVENAEASDVAETQNVPRTLSFCFSLCDNTTTAGSTDDEAEPEIIPDEVLVTLGIAVLFGFSERFLSNFTGKLEGAFEKKPADA